MLKEKIKRVMSEEVVLYSNYLGLAEDSQYIRNLINNLTNLFIDKVNKIGLDKIKKGERDIFNLNYSSQEIRSLGPFYEECLDFKEGFVIQVADKKYYLDKYGIIIKGERKGENMLEVSSLSNYTLMLRKQTFISKIYQAIKSNIKVIKGEDYAKIFQIVNAEYLDYENNFQAITDNLSFPKDNFKRTRSLR